VDGEQHGVEARIRLAVVMAKEGNVEGARTLLQSLRSENRELSVRLYLAEGEVLRDAGRTNEQMEVLSTALEEYPGNVDLLYARALTAEKLDRIDWLERDLREILDGNPNNAAALNALGYTLADRTDRHKEALGYIERALKLEPDDPAILDSMGWVLYRLGRPAEAIDYLRKALALGHDAEIAAHLGEVLWITGGREEAKRVWNEALEKTPDAALIRNTMERLQR
jgi:tetratricopeptide (TPR) repeat protein